MDEEQANEEKSVSAEEVMELGEQTRAMTGAVDAWAATTLDLMREADEPQLIATRKVRGNGTVAILVLDQPYDEVSGVIKLMASGFTGTGGRDG